MADGRERVTAETAVRNVVENRCMNSPSSCAAETAVFMLQHISRKTDLLDETPLRSSRVNEMFQVANTKQQI